jgi:hypothetical protein
MNNKNITADQKKKIYIKFHEICNNFVNDWDDMIKEYPFIEDFLSSHNAYHEGSIWFALDAIRLGLGLSTTEADKILKD